jgi:hypothetical protein
MGPAMTPTAAIVEGIIEGDRERNKKKRIDRNFLGESFNLGNLRGLTRCVCFTAYH